MVKRRMMAVFVMMVAVLSGCAVADNTAFEIETEYVPKMIVSENENTEGERLPRVEYRADEKAYLITENGDEHGPFEYVDAGFPLYDLYNVPYVRFIDDHGLYGYLDRESGEPAIKAQFTEAGAFTEDYARVREKNGMINYIDKNGHLTLSESIYVDGTDPERQGFLAVVKREDGLHDLLNIRSGEVEVYGCDEITIPEATDRGTYVKDGEVHLYGFKTFAQIEDIRIYPECVSAREVVGNDFFIIEDNHHKKGVCYGYNGETYIECKYDKVNYAPIYNLNDDGGIYMFLCTSGNHVDTYYMTDSSVTMKNER